MDKTMRAGPALFALLGLALIPAQGGAQGWIEPGIDRGSASVERVRGDVRIHVEGRVASVEVTEWFINRGGRLGEADYLYPLPGEAVFENVSLFQGETELRGEIMDAEKARRIYEEIVRKRRDPALIELAGHGLLRARVFPLAPGEERRVTLRYTQVLERAGNALQLVYAGTVSGSEPARSGAQEPGGTRLTIDIEDPDRFLDPFSPTHALSVERERGSLSVKVDDDVRGRLSVFLPLAGEAVGLSLAMHRPVAEDGYFMLTLSPDGRAEAAQPRDVTVVLDVSGSMSGDKLEQARIALLQLLGSLGTSDRFRLVAFSDALRVLNGRDWSNGGRDAVRRAGDWLEALRADGGTNIGAALEEAFRVQSPDNRLPVVVFLTDGLPSVGEQSPEKLADSAELHAGRARVFAFGVGHDVNTHLLDRLGEAGRGSTDYVEPGENVERAISLLSAKIRHPVLTDVELAGAPVRISEIYPVTLPDVFAGQDLVLFGRYAGAGSGRVTVGGRRLGETVRFSAEARFPKTLDANAEIPRLWASRKLGHLERQIWTEGESESLIREIREVALRYGLPSRYTSYLVEEPRAVATGGGGRRRTDGGLVRGSAPAALGFGATGASAVRQADEAKARRETRSTADLQRSDDRFAEELAASLGDDGAARVVGGRLFHQRDGVWVDTMFELGTEVLEVHAFSRAYFDVLGALPELGDVLRDPGDHLIGGREIGLRVGDSGVEQLSQTELRRLVERFRSKAGSR